MPQENHPNQPQHRTLITTRIIWAAMLVGQIGFMAAIAVVWNLQNTFQLNPDTARLLFYISLGMLFTLIPLGYTMRSQTYKRYWQAHAVTPAGYLQGNIVLLAMCESVAIIALVATLLSGTWWPTLAPAVAAMAVQVVNFPNGRPMQPANPAFPDQHRKTP